MKVIDHKLLMRQRATTAHLEPLIASNDGYMITTDNRIAFRWAVGANPVTLWRSETNTLGLDTPGITPKDVFALASRLVQLPDLELAALDLQRYAARMRMLLLKAKFEQKLSAKLTVDIAQILRETERFT